MRALPRASFIVTVLTLLGGKVVWGEGEFGPLAPSLPPAMPDWSPVRQFGGYQHAPVNASPRSIVGACGCHGACGVHGHDHASAWTSSLPISDHRSFWGALGCSCWAF